MQIVTVAMAGLAPLPSVAVVLLGLLGALSWLNRRRGAGGLGAPQRSVSLTAQHAVHIVEISGQRMLIGTGPSGAPRLLAELGETEADAEATDSVGVPRRFDREGGALALLLERFGPRSWGRRDP